MPIVIGAVVPHGFPIIPDISDDADGALATRAAMEEVNRRFDDAGVEVVFVVGPHGVRVNGFVAVADTLEGAGTLHYKGRTVEMNVLIDTALTDSIVAAARARGVAVAEVGYGGSARQGSALPLDWGVMTPLWFAGHNRNMPGYGHVLASFFLGEPERRGPKVVIANPSHRMPREANVEFGKAVAEAANADSRRIGFIASCDWAHRHDPNGPGGFHPDAKRMDALVVQAIKDNDPLSLIDLPDEFIHNAAIDGLWQLLMLAGAQQITPMDVEFLCYEAPTYYGMIVATYHPRR